MSLYSALCEVSGSLSSNGGASANGNGNGNGGTHIQKAPYAWDAPENVEITEETTFTWFASPYNPDDLGIVPHRKNEVASVIEVTRQLPPSYTYEGPLGGAGPFGLLAPKVGSVKYEDYVASQKTKEKEKYNSKTIGIAPLAKNDRTAISEVDKQTEGPTLWEKFSTGLVEGYTREPEDVNVFEESVTNAGKALTGIASPSNYYLLAIAGGVLLLILLIK